MSYAQHARFAATQRLKAELAKPYESEPREDGIIYSDDEFDPWSLFPSLYGSYSSEFDQCAIDVLGEISRGSKERNDLGAEMFREMLCTAEFCDYGTSPRVCFWALERPLLENLLLRWRHWFERQWNEDSTAQDGEI